MPAYVGMTQFGLMENLVSREKPYAQDHKQQAHYGDYHNYRSEGQDATPYVTDDLLLV